MEFRPWWAIVNLVFAEACASSHSMDQVAQVPQNYEKNVKIGRIDRDNLGLTSVPLKKIGQMRNRAMRHKIGRWIILLLIKLLHPPSTKS